MSSSSSFSRPRFLRLRTSSQSSLSRHLSPVAFPPPLSLALKPSQQSSVSVSILNTSRFRIASSTRRRRRRRFEARTVASPTRTRFPRPEYTAGDGRKNDSMVSSAGWLSGGSMKRSSSSLLLLHFASSSLLLLPLSSSPRERRRHLLLRDDDDDDFELPLPHRRRMISVPLHSSRITNTKKKRAHTETLILFRNNNNKRLLEMQQRERARRECTRKSVSAQRGEEDQRDDCFLYL